MEIKNLTPRDKMELESRLGQMQLTNPTLSWLSYPMGDRTGPGVAPTGPHHVPHVPLGNDPVELLELVGHLRDALEAINTKLDHIFGGHVVIDGKLVRIT